MTQSQLRIALVFGPLGVGQLVDKRPRYWTGSEAGSPVQAIWKPGVEMYCWGRQSGDEVNVPVWPGADVKFVTWRECECAGLPDCSVFCLTQTMKTFSWTRPSAFF